ncbi:Calpain-like protease palB/RIM13 [Dissostichus eleginoides]|uniref:Calpain-like protease palB/RIM13 n=1 Tax=Dissostichus eleginoides TaxID=100907 RepID=A0AAD9FIS4_DISEL|nr:Calpain-like protease palB/RIM13 [Dissostichus eleginoides]
MVQDTGPWLSIAFDKIVCLPNTLKLSQLDEGQGIEAAFLLHNATTHADCSTTKQNFRGLKRGTCPTKMIQTPTSSPVRAVDMNIIQQRPSESVQYQAGTTGNACGRTEHSSKLKNRILSYFPDMDAHKQGRDVVLICNEDVGAALGKACEHDADNDAVHLARAANIVRKDMFKMKQDFSGSFDAHCQEESVPVSLLALVSMVLYGPNITAQTSSAFIPQPALTLSQLLLYNSLVRQREIATTSRPTTRHSKDRETPLPIYLGIMIHTKTRKRPCGHPL